jgi:hypothetical protein
MFVTTNEVTELHIIGNEWLCYVANYVMLGVQLYVLACMLRGHWWEASQGSSAYIWSIIGIRVYLGHLWRDPPLSASIYVILPLLCVGSLCG